MTPGTTPLGTRFVRTFLAFGVSAGTANADARAETEAACTCCCWGGGAVCRVLETAVGSASRACRKPKVRKSRCFCAASRLVRMSECSSEFCSSAYG